MLVFLTLINVGNLFFWVEWAIRMRNKRQRRKWVTRKWLNADGFSDAELTMMIKFAEEFRVSFDNFDKKNIGGSGIIFLEILIINEL